MWPIYRKKYPFFQKTGSSVCKNAIFSLFVIQEAFLVYKILIFDTLEAVTNDIFAKLGFVILKLMFFE